MKSLPVSRSILFVLLVLAMLQFACNFGTQLTQTTQPQSGGSLPATSNPAPTEAANPAPPAAGNSNAGQVVISGAVNKTYTPINLEAGTLGTNMIVNLHETTTDGVSLAFPPDTQPGTYAIEDHLKNPVVDFSGEYDQFKLDAFYLSTGGTLTLTATGSKFSGTFEFTAVNSKDSSKTIKVAGSFTDVPVGP
jgi:hypothetical protein